MDFRGIVSHFNNPKWRGPNSCLVTCPCHQDSKQSLGISVKDGKTLLHCFAGCATEDILKAAGLTMQDLFIDAGQGLDVSDKLQAGLARWNGGVPPERIYHYRDENYVSQYVKIRYPGKVIRYARVNWSDGTFQKGRGDVKPVLYGLPELIAAVKAGKTIYYTEGEKDVTTLREMGLAATTAGGTGDWKQEFAKYFKGANVVILPDNDNAGRTLAERVKNDLIGIAASIKVVPTSQTQKGDVTDFLIQEGHVRDEFLALVEAAPFVSGNNQMIKAENKPVLRSFATVPYEPPKWLIAPYLQIGKGTLVQADNGTGKTAFACAIAAHVSTGKPLLENEVCIPGDVLVLSVEDDLPVLRGRIEANGGNLNKCHFMTHAGELSMNSPEVEEAIKMIGAVLVILDPLQCFIGSEIDMHRANETRPALAKFFDMCERNHCAALIIAHMGKDGLGKSAVNRALGSVDIPAAMRSIIQIIRNPEDERECIAIHIKCSNAPRGKSLSYMIGDRGGIRWTGYHPMTVEDLTAVIKRKERGVDYDAEPLVQVFRQLITDKPGGGFWSYASVKELGMKTLGFPPFATVNDLKAKINGVFAKELQERDGLIVTDGHKQSGVRGIRIEQFKPKIDYQTNMGTGTGR